MAFESDNMEPYLKEVVKNFMLELSVTEIETMTIIFVENFLQKRKEKIAQAEELTNVVADIKKTAVRIQRIEKPRSKTRPTSPDAPIVK